MSTVDDNAVEDELNTPFKRRIALGVTLVALLGGLLGYLASDAGARQSTMDRQAEQAAVSALTSQMGAQVELYEQFGDYVDASMLKRRHDVAVVGQQLLGQDPVAGTAQDWQVVQGQLDDLTPLLRSGDVADRPDLLSNSLFVEPDRAALRQQVLQATAGSWGDKSNLYVGGVTLLAVAITLLGLSLTVGSGIRRIFVWPAAVLAAVTIVGSGVLAVVPPASTPMAAVDAVVEGDRLAAGRDFDAAIQQYDRAIALDDQYAVAYSRRAASVLLAGSPERGTATFVVTTTSPAARAAAIADFNRALELGGDDYSILVNQGANYFHQAEYETSEDFSRRAIALNPDLPLPWLNLGLAQVGLGQADEARATYERAIGLIQRRPTLLERGELYASSRGALTTVAIQTPSQEQLAVDLQAMLVKAEGAAVLPKALAAPDAGASSLRLQAVGSILQAQLNYTNLPTGARVAFIVYYRPAKDQDWLQRTDLSLYEASQLVASGAAVKNIVDATCPNGGDYRVDFYADGKRLASATTAHPTTNLTFTPYVDAIGGIGVCKPAAWSLTGVMTGSVTLESPDKQRQLIVRTVPVLSPPKTEAERVALEQAVLDRMQRELSTKATVFNAAQQMYYPLIGPARMLHLDPTTDGYVWAVIGADNVMRTVEARYPSGTPGELTELSARIRFG